MKTLCPICADILLRHLTHSRILWFCPRCRQEMPNFDLVKFSAISKKIIQVGSYLNNYEAGCLKNKIQNSNNSILVIEHQYTVVNSFVNLGQKKLEVVDFIIDKINMILINTFADTEQYPISQQNYLSQVEHTNLKQSTLIKTDSLKDHEIILLYICQTILVIDNALFNNVSLPELKAQSVNLKLTIDHSYSLDVIIFLWLFWGKMI